MRAAKAAATMVRCTCRSHTHEMGPWSDVATRNGRSLLLLRDEARGKMRTMVTQSQPECQNLGSASLRELLSSRQMVRGLVAFCCFEAAYYFGYRYGMSFTQVSGSPFWFPDSVLLCALLRTRP